MTTPKTALWQVLDFIEEETPTVVYDLCRRPGCTEGQLVITAFPDESRMVLTCLRCPPALVETIVGTDGTLRSHFVEKGRGSDRDLAHIDALLLDQIRFVCNTLKVTLGPTSA